MCFVQSFFDIYILSQIFSPNRSFPRITLTTPINSRHLIHVTQRPVRKLSRVRPNYRHPDKAIGSERTRRNPLHFPLLADLSMVSFCVSRRPGCVQLIKLIKAYLHNFRPSPRTKRRKSPAPADLPRLSGQEPLWCIVGIVFCSFSLFLLGKVKFTFSLLTATGRGSAKLDDEDSKDFFK